MCDIHLMFNLINSMSKTYVECEIDVRLQETITSKEHLQISKLLTLVDYSGESSL